MLENISNLVMNLLISFAFKMYKYILILEYAVASCLKLFQLTTSLDRVKTYLNNILYVHILSYLLNLSL